MRLLAAALAWCAGCSGQLQPTTQVETIVYAAYDRVARIGDNEGRTFRSRRVLDVLRKSGAKP
ncbi:MAG: hypothetical protein HYV63_03545 [Candidatus Schekmanbacteria bacterium]|nr:hypothetical protein [Candidatus Schekmanbacteria bacterium]